MSPETWSLVKIKSQSLSDFTSQISWHLLFIFSRVERWITSRVTDVYLTLPEIVKRGWSLLLGEGNPSRSVWDAPSQRFSEFHFGHSTPAHKTSLSWLRHWRWAVYPLTHRLSPLDLPTSDLNERHRMRASSAQTKIGRQKSCAFSTRESRPFSTLSSEQPSEQHRAAPKQVLPCRKWRSWLSYDAAGAIDHEVTWEELLSNFKSNRNAGNISSAIGSAVAFKIAISTSLLRKWLSTTVVSVNSTRHQHTDTEFFWWHHQWFKLAPHHHTRPARKLYHMYRSGTSVEIIHNLVVALLLECGLF